MGHLEEIVVSTEETLKFRKFLSYFYWRNVNVTNILIILYLFRRKFKNASKKHPANFFEILENILKKFLFF